MKKINKPTSKQKEKAMADSVGAMLPPIQAQGASPLVWPMHKSSWAQLVSIRKPVLCGTCKKDMKPYKVGIIWNSDNNYMAIAFIGFGERLLGFRLVKFFEHYRSPICLQCLASGA